MFFIVLLFLFKRLKTGDCVCDKCVYERERNSRMCAVSEPGTDSTRRPGDTNICVNHPTYGDPMMISLFVTYNSNIMTS